MRKIPIVIIVLILVMMTTGLVFTACKAGDFRMKKIAAMFAGVENARMPEAVCAAPSLIDTSAPSTIVGDGTPASCTRAALQTAASAGGIVTFNCGGAVTINVASPVIVTRETVIDGGGLVALDGGGASRILYLDSWYDQTTPRLTVQRLAFANGSSGAASGDDTADGGGAIYRDGGSLTVINCTFTNNRAPSAGQDIAGGAIYAFGGGETVIAGSTFSGNAASNGGAVGSLNGHVTIIDSVFTGNQATGTGGNPGNGGCGGAVYMDGADETTSLCNVTIANNSAGAIGGGFFRVSNDGSGSFAMDRTAVNSNQVTAAGSGLAGGLYLQGLAMSISNSAITRNRAYYNGGIWMTTSRVLMTNVTVAENTATGSNGGGLWLSGSPTGTILNCTIANNQATLGTDVVAGAIFSRGLSIKNTIIAGNDADWSPGCNEWHESGGGNIEWPVGADCTLGPLVADPLLGALGGNGGPTETMLPDGAGPARARGRGCPATDQRGVARHEPCTAGAVEVP